MFLLLARIFSVVFTLLVVIKSYLDVRAKKESLTMFVFWTLTWLGITAIAFYHQIIDVFLGNPSVNGGTGTVLGVGLIFIYFVIYRVYVKADRIEKQLNKLVRDMSTQKAVKARRK